MKALHLAWLLLFLGIYLSLGNPAMAQDYLSWPGLTGFARYSPHGRKIIRLSDRTLELWSSHKPTRLRRMAVSQPLVDAQFSPDGQFLVAGSEAGVYTVWRSSDYKRIFELKDPSEGRSNQPFTLSPDGKYLTVCKLFERVENNKQWLDFYLHIWNLSTGRKEDTIFVSRTPNRMPGHFPVVSASWHPLGRFLSTAMEWDQGEGKLTPTFIQVLDLWEGRWIYWVPGAPSAEYSQNGEYFAFLSPVDQRHNPKWQISLWHTRADRFKTLKPKGELSIDSGLTVSAKGNLLAYLVAYSNNQKTVFVHSTRDLRLKAQFRIPDSADSVSISPDETTLLVSSFSDPTFAVRIYALPKR